ncbi:MAG: HupE/UreJ family protein [Actinomycetota bacterium]
MNEQTRVPVVAGGRWRGLLLLLAPLTLILTLASPASAHRGEQSYLYFDVTETELEGRVEFPYTDVREVFDLELEGSSEEIQAELEANLDELIDYALTHTSIGAGGLAWNLDFDGVELLSDREDTDGEPGYAILPFTVDVPGSEVPRELDITFTPFFDELLNRDSIVLVSNDWQRGVFEAEANELVFLNPGNRSGTLDLGSPSQWLNFTGSVELGVDHIRTGPDHVLFVLVLLLPSVLVFQSIWRPAPSFGSSLWRVLKIVTMFTIAHSITFSLAGLDFIPLPPSALVETIIAVSIAAAAIHNLRPVVQNREWVLAFVFGLFHGLGFASLVDALDTSRTAQLVSLLGRNVGIEIGQAIAILIAFPALFLLRRTRYYQPLFVIGSIGLAVISLIWAAERIFGFDLGTTDLAVLFLKWPRILWVMIVATAITAVIYRVEDQAGRLLPVAGDDTDSSADETVGASTAG